MKLNIQNIHMNSLITKWLKNIDIQRIMKESGITEIYQVTIDESINVNCIRIQYTQDNTIKSIKIDLEETLINILKEGK